MIMTICLIFVMPAAPAEGSGPDAGPDPPQADAASAAATETLRRRRTRIVLVFRVGQVMSLHAPAPLLWVLRTGERSYSPGKGPLPTELPPARRAGERVLEVPLRREGAATASDPS